MTNADGLNGQKKRLYALAEMSPVRKHTAQV